MSWIDNIIVFQHDTFIVFIECKVDDRGHWARRTSPQSPLFNEVLTAIDNSEYNLVHLIEPDGLRRILKFQQGATLSIQQNVFSYKSAFVEEITIDEKEQSGKGRTRDKL